MSQLTVSLSTACTFLFVPANRPDRYTKATATGADLVVLDLEDAVPASEKTDARRHAAQWLSQGNRGAIRINGFDTAWHPDDLAAVADQPCTVMVPKAEDPNRLGELISALPNGSAVIALIETANGVLRAAEIARTPGVHRLAFGSFDLAAQLGVAPDDQLAMTWARGALVVASAAAAIAPPIDGVTGDVQDLDRLRRDVGYAARLGFTAKLCIHPHQVPLVAEGFRPSEQDLSWAHAVVAAAASTSGLVMLHGQMVDKPVVERARRILAQVQEQGVQ